MEEVLHPPGPLKLVSCDARRDADVTLGARRAEKDVRRDLFATP
jgi:hypothetical protein